MDDEVFFALSALLLAEELAAKRAHLAACTLTDGALAEGSGSARLLRCRPPRGAYLSCGGHAVKRGKGTLSARDTLRFRCCRRKRKSCAAISGLLLAAGSRALRTELLPLFSSALEDRAALKELLFSVSPERAEGKRELFSQAKKAQKELSALSEEIGAE